MKILKSISTDVEQKEVQTKPIGQMQPLEVCVVVGSYSYKNTIVMRTASTIKFEVINLSKLGHDRCWTNEDCSLQVKPFEGKSITLNFE